MKIADGWIRTRVLWCRKRKLCQQCHTPQSPQMFVSLQKKKSFSKMFRKIILKVMSKRTRQFVYVLNQFFNQDISEQSAYKRFKIVNSDTSVALPRNLS